MVWAWIGLGIVAVVVLSVVALWGLGSRLPEEHVASAGVRLRSGPEAVWPVVSDAAGHASWAPGVTKLERLPDRGGRECWRQHMGRNSFVLETTAAEPPRRLVRTITDDHGPFSGSWEYLVEPEGDGCRVTLTERGRIKSAVPRAVMRYMVGERVYIKKHLGGLAKRFGEEPRWV